MTRQAAGALNATFGTILFKTGIVTGTTATDLPV
jgi:hypothetical protein